MHCLKLRVETTEFMNRHPSRPHTQAQALRAALLNLCLVIAPLTGAAHTAAAAAAEPTAPAARASAHDVAAPPTGLRIERVVMLSRHGLRAPIEGEAAVARWLPQPMATFSTPPSQITPQGAAALRLMADYQRGRLIDAGLLPARGCPRAAEVWLHANTSPRTIASAEHIAASLAPGCDLAVSHLAPGSNDPLFQPLQAHAVPFDAARAVAAIDAETGGPAAIAAPYRAEFELLHTVLGCHEPDAPRALTASPACHIPDTPARVRANARNDGIALDGPIDLASGTAQVLALQYAEGLPMSEVGWGRVSREQITALSRLHALLFEVHARPAVMSRAVAGPLAERMLALLTDAQAPRVAMLVGHDTNIAALTALLGMHFQLDSYGRDDPPPGGVLSLQLWREAATGQAYVRAVYEAQTLDQLRYLTTLNARTPPARQVLPIADCPAVKDDLCRLEDLAARIRRRLDAAP